jgi:hypothetical protein
MLSRPGTDVLLPDIDDGAEEVEETDDPVLRSVLTAPVRPGQPAAWEAEALREAAAGPWFEGSSVSAEIAARARRER